MDQTEPMVRTVVWLGETWGYWIQTVAFFLAALGTLIAASVGVFQLSALRKQIKKSEEHSAEQIRLFREQVATAQAHSSKQIELLKEQMLSEKLLSRQRATVEVVRHEQTDRELTEAFKGYADLREQKGELTKLACTHPNPTEKHALILRVLNNYEYIATGIHTGAFDEEIYKRMKHGNLIRDWDALKPYVTQLRSDYKKPRIFVEFEKLAELWRSNPPTG